MFQKKKKKKKNMFISCEQIFENEKMSVCMFVGHIEFTLSVFVCFCLFVSSRIMSGTYLCPVWWDLKIIWHK